MAKRSRSKILLFIDLLGTRVVTDSTIGSLQRRLNYFAQTVAEGVDEAASTYGSNLVSVDIESDAAALRFVDPVEAALTGVALFHRAALKTYDGERDAELAFRGVITRIQDARPLRAKVPLHDFPELNRVRLSSSFLQAIMLEKSGLKGSRLVASPAVLSQGIRTEIRRRYRSVHRIDAELCERLSSGHYPSDLSNWLDILWPLHDPNSLGSVRQVVERRINRHRQDSGATRNLRATLEVIGAAEDS